MGDPKVDVSDYSAHPDEAEVVLAPGTALRVKAILKQGELSESVRPRCLGRANFSRIASALRGAPGSSLMENQPGLIPNQISHD